MKLTVERTPFLRALGHARTVVDQSTPIPIASHVLLRAETDRLVIAGTDFDMEIVETISCQTEEPGVIAVPFSIVYGLINKAPDGAQISIETTDGGRARIRAGRFKSDVPCLPPDTFPAMVMDGDRAEFNIPTEEFSALLERVSFLSPADPKHPFPVICGTYLHVTDGVLRAVATDTVMLGRTDVALPVGAEDMPGITLPATSAKQLTKLLSAAGGDVTVRVGKRLAQFQTGDITLTTKLIGQEYPDYARTIPVKNDKIMELDRALFAAILGRAALFYEGRDNAIILQCADGKVTVSAVNTEFGNFTEKMEVFYDSEPIRFGVNGRRLSTLCGAVSGDALRMTIGDPGKPILVTDPADKTTMYMIVPLRV